MLNFFTSSKKRLEQRMLKLCLNTEKPQAMTAMNRLGTPAWLVQPAAKSGDDEPIALNVIAPADRARGDVLVQPLPVSRKARR